MKPSNGITIRNVRPADHQQVIAIMPDWWGGRDLTVSDFHQRMGFIIEPGNAVADGLPVSKNFLRKDDPKVLFRKNLSQG